VLPFCQVVSARPLPSFTFFVGHNLWSENPHLIRCWERLLPTHGSETTPSFTWNLVNSPRVGDEMEPRATIRLVK
jgi:hypothetical protein